MFDTKSYPEKNFTPEEVREIEYFCNMQHAKRDILQTFKTTELAAKILIDVFSLCIGNADHNNLEERHKELYDCLFALYLANREKPLIDSLEENLPSIISLAKIFQETKSDIREIDISLYYAILGFIDFLKTSKANFIYNRIILRYI